MRLKTMVFELRRAHYRNMTELARAMGISISQVYRVQEGKRNINEKFIVGAMRAFPRYSIDDLFYLDSTPSTPIDQPTAAEKREVEIIKQALKRLELGGGRYGQYLKSQLSTLISLNKASQELESGTKELNRVLSYLAKEKANSATDNSLS